MSTSTSTPTPDSTARQRHPASATTTTSSAPTSGKQQTASKPAAAAPSLSVLDVLRVLAGLVLLSCGTSYLTSSGSSLTWGYNPWWTRARDWKAFVRGPISLTDAQLAAYDGSDPAKPIYLALNGSIYDVSAAPATYGPGGNYHVFAGKDAARAFVTGCFAEDAVPDLRGVEDMFLPLELDADDEDEEEKKLSKGFRKNRRAQEVRAARRKVRDGLEHWHGVFRGDGGKAYFWVGEVKREEGWEERMPRRALCESVQKKRVKRGSGKGKEKGGK